MIIIYIYSEDDNNKLFIYILTDANIVSDIKLNFNSYQNTDSYYKHNNYILTPEIFWFKYNLCNIKKNIRCKYIF